MAGSFLALSWSYFPEYQKPCYVLPLAQVVHFEVDSTHCCQRAIACLHKVPPLVLVSPHVQHDKA